MLEDYLNFACTIYKQSLDEYGDVRQINAVSTSCWYRDNNTLVLNTAEETEQSKAMAWFAANEDIGDGDILTVDGHSYIVLDTIKARRLGEIEVQFIKCNLQRFDGFVS